MKKQWYWESERVWGNNRYDFFACWVGKGLESEYVVVPSELVGVTDERPA